MELKKPVRRIAIVGTGVIGASWAAEFLAQRGKEGGLVRYRLRDHNGGERNGGVEGYDPA